MVLRHRDLTEGARVLMIVMADRMDGRRYVSVPRSVLADMLDVAPARITERILVAKELGVLDVVQAGRPGRTATYQGLFPTGTHVRTKSRRENAISAKTEDGTHVRTPGVDRLGTGERTPIGAQLGTHVPDASSKRRSPEALVLSPSVEGLEDSFDRGLALASTALGRAAAEDTRVRTTKSTDPEECGQLTPTDATKTIKPTDLPDDWTPNAQHRVMMTSRDLDHTEVVEEFRATYAAVFERRRNWDTTFAAFIQDWSDNCGASSWAVA